MLELAECLGYIFWHVEINSAGGVIPVNVDAAEEGTVPVCGDCVVFFKVFFEMDDVVT